MNNYLTRKKAEAFQPQKRSLRNVLSLTFIVICTACIFMSGSEAFASSKQAAQLCSDIKANLRGGIEGFATNAKTGVHEIGDFDRMKEKFNAALKQLEALGTLQAQEKQPLNADCKLWRVPVKGSNEKRSGLADQLSIIIHHAESSKTAPNGSQQKTRALFFLARCINILSQDYLGGKKLYTID